MKNISIIKAAFLVSLILVGVSSYSQVLSGTGSYSGAPGFDRGFQTTTYCGNYPESWIRGSVFLDKQTGLLTMHIDLETDATHAGPKGQVLAYVYDSYGNLLTRVASAEVGRGGKMPGRFERTTAQASFNLGPSIGSQASKIVVVANCTGFVNRFFNITTDQIRDALGFIQQFAIFFF